MSDKISSRNYILESPAELFQPGLSVDCVIFGFHESNMKILLSKIEKYDTWMLPGGFVLKDESLNDAASRILYIRTGLNDVYLRQFYTFGDKDRTKLSENESFFDGEREIAYAKEHKHWFLQRFVSVGYYALVDYSKVQLNSSTNEELNWVDISDIPSLYTDHNEIVCRALFHIRINLSILPIGYELLPEKFMMSELRIIYETILGTSLDRRNFQRKMLATGLIVKLEETSKKFGIKASTLFQFNKEAYDKALSEGFLLLL